jgi:Flp pilus assembly protein TadD
MALGYWYERRGRLEDARAAYEAGRWAAERERDVMSQAYLDNNLAMVELRLGNVERAKRLLRECLWLYPRHPEALRNLERLRS